MVPMATSKFDFSFCFLCDVNDRKILCYQSKRTKNHKTLHITITQDDKDDTNEKNK